MKKEQLSNSETPKIKHALAEKYEKEDQEKHQQEIDGYERLKTKEASVPMLLKSPLFKPSSQSSIQFELSTLVLTMSFNLFSSLCHCVRYFTLSLPVFGLVNLFNILLLTLRLFKVSIV